MNVDELRRKVNNWDQTNSSESPIANSEYLEILAHLEHISTRDWGIYSPIINKPEFSRTYVNRLAAWLGNVDSESDQKLLLRYAFHISYFSENDFKSLYATAFQREIYPWLSKELGSNLDLNGFQGFSDTIRATALDKTWYCPLTSSMDINHFYKVNGITGISHQPVLVTEFDTYKRLKESDGAATADALVNRWRNYMLRPSQSSQSSLDYIVLLEDIVGSGSQTIKALEWVTQEFGKPVLFVPLILCPNGAEKLSEKARNLNGKLTISPVIELGKSDLLGPYRDGVDEWLISEELEDLVYRMETRVSPGNIENFGYKDTGCSIAKFSNTPNNSIPLIHNADDLNSWVPLFPRVFRD